MYDSKFYVINTYLYIYSDSIVIPMITEGSRKIINEYDLESLPT